MANADKARRNDMLQKSTDELYPIQGHDLLSVIVSIVLVMKEHLVVFHLEKAMVADRYTMRVSR